MGVILGLFMSLRYGMGIFFGGMLIPYTFDSMPVIIRVSSSLDLDHNHRPTYQKEEPLDYR